VGLALTIVERLAISAAHGQAGDRHRVASQGGGSIGVGKVGIAMVARLYLWKFANLIRRLSLANPRWGAPRIHRGLPRI
jgi:hypothetical protein